MKKRKAEGREGEKLVLLEKMRGWWGCYSNTARSPELGSYFQGVCVRYSTFSFPAPLSKEGPAGRWYDDCWRVRSVGAWPYRC